MSSILLALADGLRRPASLASLPSQWVVRETSWDQAPERLINRDIQAVVVVVARGQVDAHPRDFNHLIDAICQQNQPAILLVEDDLERLRLKEIVGFDLLTLVAWEASSVELHGRLATLAALRPALDQLQRENSLLRKFDSGLNHEIDQMDQEMRLAARLQIDFLPRQLPKLRGTEFKVMFRPATYVSGDMYDALRLDEEHVGFYIADIVGHGMPAALLTIYIKRALKFKEILERGYRLLEPHETLALLNDDMYDQHLSVFQFASMIYGILNTRTLELKLARAGHPLPLKLTPDGRVEEMDCDGSLLGITPKETYTTTRVQLKPGDRVLFFSDGFELAFDELDSTDPARWSQTFGPLCSPHAPEAFDDLVQSLDSRKGSLHPKDDQTALLLITPV